MSVLRFILTALWDGLAAWITLGIACAAGLLMEAFFREDAREVTGIAPPGHPDLDAPLVPWEQDALEGIAANWNTVLDGEREHP